MKSFSQKTKEYLLTVETDSECCRFAELTGIALFAGRLRNGQLRVLSEFEGTVKKFITLIAACFGKSLEIYEGKGNYFCIISGREIINKLFSENTVAMLQENVAAKDCCRGAFLRGAFLGGGTVVDPNKNYNMEFLIPDDRLLNEFMDILNALGLSFKNTVRKGSIVVYVKNSEAISDALGHMGAFSAQMELLNIKIEKEIRNDMNRAANGETANMDKILTASAQQIKAIQKIQTSIGLDNISDELREVAILRNKYKDISLEKLGKMLNPHLSKSGVNHRIKKIISIAENI